MRSLSTAFELQIHMKPKCPTTTKAYCHFFNLWLPERLYIHQRVAMSLKNAVFGCLLFIVYSKQYNVNKE